MSSPAFFWPKRVVEKISAFSPDGSTTGQTRGFRASPPSINRTIGAAYKSKSSARTKSVEVVYPCSENTVLVIQQLFSNLLSAAFIPVFKALRDVGTGRGLDDATLDAMRADGMKEVPQYTFSFYMLIVIHALSTCYFATFNGTYLRYEAEEEKKAKKEERRRLLAGGQNGGYGSAER